jgi:hypothetical protein
LTADEKTKIKVDRGEIFLHEGSSVRRNVPDGIEENHENHPRRESDQLPPHSTYRISHHGLGVVSILKIYYVNTGIIIRKYSPYTFRFSDGDNKIHNKFKFHA